MYCNHSLNLNLVITKYVNFLFKYQLKFTAKTKDKAREKKIFKLNKK